MPKGDGWKKKEREMGKAWSGKSAEKGDTVHGVLRRVQENVGPNNSKMYTLETPEGEMVEVWGSKILDDYFSTEEIGAEVIIEYQGKERSEKTGREYHNYDFFVREAPFRKKGTSKDQPDEPKEIENKEKVDEDDTPF